MRNYMKYGDYEQYKGEEVLWCYKYQAPCADIEFNDQHPCCAECIEQIYRICTGNEHLHVEVAYSSPAPELAAESDPVNHPAHYNAGDIEFIDALESAQTREEHCGYLQGNAMKYLWRYTHKGKAEEDLRKAEWYLQRLINVVQHG